MLYKKRLEKLENSAYPGIRVLFERDVEQSLREAPLRRGGILVTIDEEDDVL